jgi:hypothetical protein
MATVLEQLELIRTNVTENWDGYGGLAPLPEAVDAAVEFYHLLKGLPGIAEPYVSPTPNGGVVFAWWNGPHELEIDFEPSRERGRIDTGFVYLNTATKVSAEGGLGTLPPTAIPFPLREIVAGALTAVA